MNIFTSQTTWNVNALVTAADSGVEANYAGQFQQMTFLTASNVNPPSGLTNVVTNSLKKENNNSFSCLTCGKKYTALGSLRRHEITHTTNPIPFSCEICNIKYTQPSSLATHMKSAHGGGLEKRHKCQLCDARFRKLYELGNHTIRWHEDQVCSADGEFGCDQCEKKFTSALFVSRHKKLNHEKIKCRFCPKEFNKYDLKGHTERCHTSGKGPLCPTCGVRNCGECVTDNKEDNNPSKRTDSSGKVSKLKRHTCVTCDKQFNSRYDLVRHEVTHSNRKPFDCDLCGSRFSQRSTIVLHKSRVHGINVERLTTFSCKYCTKRSKKKIDLDIHIIKCHEDQVIHQRGLGTTTEKDLLQEQITSMSSVQSDCDISPRSSDLKNQYSCDICGKVYTKLIDLRAHAVSHSSNARPFVCEFCRMTFTRASTKNKHKLWCNDDQKPRRRPPPRHICNICNLAFPTYPHLATHNKIAHTATAVEQGLNENAIKPNEGPSLQKIPTNSEPLPGPGQSADQNQLEQSKTQSTVGYQCDSCDKAFKEERMLFIHKRVFHEELTCKICKKSYTRSQGFRKHMEDFHSDDAKLKRPYCNRKLRKSDLKGHIKKDHKKQSYKSKYSKRKSRRKTERRTRTKEAEASSDSDSDNDNRCKSPKSKVTEDVQVKVKIEVDELFEVKTEPCFQESMEDIEEFTQPDDGVKPAMSPMEVGSDSLHWETRSDSDSLDFNHENFDYSVPGFVSLPLQLLELSHDDAAVEAEDIKPNYTPTMTAMDLFESKPVKRNIDDKRTKTRCRLCESLPRAQLTQHILKYHCKPISVKLTKMKFRPLLQSRFKSISVVCPSNDNFNIPWFICGRCGKAHIYRQRTKEHKYICTRKYLLGTSLPSEQSSDKKETQEENSEVKDNINTLPGSNFSKKRKQNIKGAALGNWTDNWLYSVPVLKYTRTTEAEFEKIKGTKKAKCTVCERLVTENNLREHLERHNESRCFICEQCGMSLSSKSTYEAHLRIHTGERPFACTFCEKRFASSSHRFVHERDVHKKGKANGVYACKFCEKVYTSYMGLNHHTRINHANANLGSGKRSFACDKCPKVFRAVKHFKDHMKNEHSENPAPATESLSLTCDLCQKTFNNEHQLSDHKLWVHTNHVDESTGPSQYQYYSSSTTTKTPKSCAKCGKTLKGGRGLKRHMLVFHNPDGKRPTFFDCKICQQGFSLIASMRSHLRTRHADILPAELMAENQATIVMDNQTMNLTLEDYFIRKKLRTF